MKLTDVNQYVALRDALLNEKIALEARLAAINRALEGKTGGISLAARLGSKPGARRGVKRAKNEMSLKQAVVKALAAKPLTRKELLQAVLKLDYKFTAKNPMNSLSTLLYSDKSIKNNGGKFSVGK